MYSCLASSSSCWCLLHGCLLHIWSSLKHRSHGNLGSKPNDCIRNSQMMQHETSWSDSFFVTAVVHGSNLFVVLVVISLDRSKKCWIPRQNQICHNQPIHLMIGYQRMICCTYELVMTATAGNNLESDSVLGDQLLLASMRYNWCLMFLLNKWNDVSLT